MSRSTSRAVIVMAKTCKTFDPTPEEPKPEKLTAEQVRAALRTRFSDSRRYAIAEEVGLQTGFSHRRLDMMVLDCYASNGFRIDGIEIKVSKADLKRELEDPEKHVAFFDVIDYFTLAFPEGVADLSVIPPKWGVMLIKGNGQTRYLRKPIALHDEIERAVPRGFLASITRARLPRLLGSVMIRWLSCWILLTFRIKSIISITVILLVIHQR